MRGSGLLHSIHDALIADSWNYKKLCGLDISLLTGTCFSAKEPDSSQGLNAEIDRCH